MGGTQHTIEFARKQDRVLFCPAPTEDVPSTKGIRKLLKEGVLPINNGQDIPVIERAISEKTQELSDSNQLIFESDNSNLQQLNLFD